MLKLEWTVSFDGLGNGSKLSNNPLAGYCLSGHGKNETNHRGAAIKLFWEHCESLGNWFVFVICHHHNTSASMNWYDGCGGAFSERGCGQCGCGGDWGDDGCYGHECCRVHDDNFWMWIVGTDGKVNKRENGIIGSEPRLGCTLQLTYKWFQPDEISGFSEL